MPRRNGTSSATAKTRQHAQKGRFLVARAGTLVYEASRQMSCVPVTAENRRAEEAQADVRRRFLRLDGLCEYCETRAASTLDHFEPLVRDQTPTPFCNDIWNCVPCCKECNSSKGGRSFDVWFASDSAFNPCRLLDQDDSRRLWVKFSSYDVMFRSRCRRKSYDMEEWRQIREKIVVFLNDLQRQVETMVIYDIASAEKKMSACV